MRRITSQLPFVLVLATVLAARPAASLAARPAANCQGTATGMVPLTDLGSGIYKGYPGGLYPDGRNEPPAAHQALALAAAQAVTPRDAAGQPAADGKVVLLSLGMSNATQEFSTFVQLARGDGAIDRHVAIVDGAQGGQTASIIRNPNANFWTVVGQRLQAAGATDAQVQAIWLKEANAGPTDPFPGHARTLSEDLAAIVQVAAGRFPNLKLVYLASRIYAGYASTTLNPEPYAYEGGFSVRWVIERQLAGESALNADPARGPVTAPVLLWGPYLWADGLTPRGDGLTWRCEDFANDGTHPSPAGRQKVAELLLRFFRSDESARPWFLADPNAPTPTAGPTFTPGPTQTPGGPPPSATASSTSLRSYRVRESPSRDALWVSTTVRQVQDRFGQVSEAQPAWLCGRVLVAGEAEWGWRFAESPMALNRNAEAAMQTTIRDIAADPAAAAAAGVRCIRIDGVLAQQDGPPPSASPTAPPPSATPTEAPRPAPAYLPIAWRSR